MNKMDMTMMTMPTSGAVTRKRKRGKRGGQRKQSAGLKLQGGDAQALEDAHIADHGVPEDPNPQGGPPNPQTAADVAARSGQHQDYRLELLKEMTRAVQKGDDTRYAELAKIAALRPADTPGRERDYRRAEERNTRLNVAAQMRFDKGKATAFDLQRMKLTREDGADQARAVADKREAAIERNRARTQNFRDRRAAGTAGSGAMISYRPVTPTQTIPDRMREIKQEAGAAGSSYRQDMFAEPTYDNLRAWSDDDGAGGGNARDTLQSFMALRELPGLEQRLRVGDTHVTEPDPLAPQEYAFRLPGEETQNFSERDIMGMSAEHPALMALKQRLLARRGANPVPGNAMAEAFDPGF